MATIVKKATGTALGTNTSWVGDVLPATTDLAQWDAASLGGSLTGNLNIGGAGGGVVINGATANLSLTAGTTTIGTGGLTFASTNNRILTFFNTATVAVGSNNQTWSLYSSAGVPWQFGGTAAFTGSATIDLVSSNIAASTVNPGLAGLYFIAGTTSGFTGTFRLGTTASIISGITTSLLANASYVVDGAGAGFGSAVANSVINGVSLTLNNDVSFFNNGGSSLTFSPSVVIGGTTRTINIASGTNVTLSGALTGTAGFTKAGSGLLQINSNTNASLTGTMTTTGASGAANTRIGTLYSAGTPNGLSGISTFAFINSSVNPAVLTYCGLSAYTEDANFTSDGAFGSASALNVLVYSANGPAGITFAPTSAGGVSNFTGSFVTFADANAALPSSSITFNEFPTSASALYADQQSGASRTTTYTFNVGGTTAALIQPQFGSTSTSGVFVLQHSAGSNALSFTGPVTKTGTAAGTLRLTGTGDSATLSGVISASAGTLAITKQDAGKWILSGANTYTGTTSISAGTLSAQSNTAFGGAGAVTQTGGTIEVTGGVALNKAGAALTLVSAAGANALTTTTGTNTLACAGITLSSTIIVDAAAGASLTVNNTAAMSGAFGITKNNSGEIGLGTFANTYTGAVTINAGTLTVGNLQNTSTASSLGTGALSSAIALTGTLKYNGTGHSTNRSITFTGSAPTLDASGSGAVTYSAATQAAGARTITFTGSSTAANTLSAALSDGTGAVSVAKSGAGKWVLSNATLNYTGTTSVSAGTLNLGSVNRTLSGVVSISGGTIENSTNTLSANVTMTGGTITAQLTGNKTLDVDSGVATLEPTNNANDYTGATTVDAGATLRLITGVNPTLGGGKVLGDSNVDVSGNLKTYGSVTQKGQMRYGGNVTFQAGAKLYVGGA